MRNPVTPDGHADVVSRLQARKTGTLKDLAREIYRATGEGISIQHLSNILTGRKKPSECVLRFLGMTAKVVYS